MLLRRARSARLASLALLAAAGTLLGACSGEPVAVEDVSRLRVANVLASGRTVDVLIDGRTVATGLSATAATDLALVEPGTHAVTLRASGTNEVLLTTTTLVGANTDVTLVAAGAAGETQAITLVDDPFAAESTTPLVRFVNAVPGGTGLDLFVGDANFDPTTSTGVAPTATNIAFGGSTAFFGVPFGPSRVIFTNTGTRTASSSAEPFSFDFEAGASTIIVAPTSVTGTAGSNLVVLGGGGSTR